MRVTKEKAAENRGKILNEAAKLFRERGLSGVGVDALTEAAGLTHGSLYSQFGSKECLMAEAVNHGFSRTAARAGEVTDIADVINRYLSAQHRDNPGYGCTMAALGSEMPRQVKNVRQTFTQGVKNTLAWIAALLPARKDRTRDEDVLALVAAMIGTLVLARAVDDPEFSDRILSAGRKRLLKDFQNDND